MHEPVGASRRTLADGGGRHRDSGIVLMKTLGLPRYWMPLIIGIGLLIAGGITWATSRETPK